MCALNTFQAAKAKAIQDKEDAKAKKESDKQERERQKQIEKEELQGQQKKAELADMSNFVTQGKKALQDDPTSDFARAYSFYKDNLIF